MPSPDLTEFFKYSQPKRRPCPLNFAREQLDEKGRAQLDSACAHDVGIITAAAIHRWLKERGHDMTMASITSHRRGVCSCGRD